MLRWIHSKTIMYLKCYIETLEEEDMKWNIVTKERENE